MSTAEEIINNARVVKLQEKTVILHLSFHCPPMRKQEKSKTVATEGDPTWFNISKKTLEAKSHKALGDIALKTRAWVIQRALPDPTGILPDGFYQIPNALVVDTQEFLDKQIAQFSEVFGELLEEYDSCVIAAKEKLRDAWRAKDYCSKAALGRKFSIDVQWLDFAIPSESKVGAEINAAELKRSREKVDEQAEIIIYALRMTFRDLLAHAAEQLAPASDGSKKKLYGTSLEKILDFCDLFAKRNVLGDEETAKLAEKAKDLYSGVDVELLRSEDMLRKVYAEKTNELKAALDAKLENAPSRMISFDDE